MKEGLILGIETSCDETAAAVVRGGDIILSNLVSSQISLHAPFRGVVPEIAARAHEENLIPLVARALEGAECSLADLDGIAVTTRPGLIGALLVGMAAAKGLALASGRPLVGVNHLEAHVYAARMTAGELPYPALALLASGGHTCLYRMDGLLEFQLLGSTTDDAVGEAFDKAASMLGLPYPGGPHVEKAALMGSPSVDFPVAKIKGRPFHFSFSGLKTALLYHLKKTGAGPLGDRPVPGDAVPDLAASFQEAAIRALVETTRRAAERERPACVVLAGGVALNRRLRSVFEKAFAKGGTPVYYPGDSLCADNAAMVAGLGYHALKANGPGSLDMDAAARVVARG